jgi:hypothetical protein
MTKTKKKVYKKDDVLNRWLTEKMHFRGWDVVEEKEIQQYNGGKGLLLGLVFLPLALLGHSKYIEVTYSKTY